uniref:Uncharacterized protein MANES_13G034900 n=1 Tax=Rhizophora mucronata TaxID=61149 RepID=A0A2P2L4Y3_RHIMU
MPFLFFAEKVLSSSGLTRMERPLLLLPAWIQDCSMLPRR